MAQRMAGLRGGAWCGYGGRVLLIGAWAEGPSSLAGPNAEGPPQEQEGIHTEQEPGSSGMGIVTTATAWRQRRRQRRQLQSRQSIEAARERR